MKHLQNHRRRLLAVDPHCRYCGDDLTFRRACLDHVVPKSAGGTNRRSNLVLCCRTCNRMKGSWSAAELLNWARRLVAVAHEC